MSCIWASLEAAGGRPRLGGALDEAYEDGPGWVQHFDGGSSGPAVICALYQHEAVAVAQAVWNVLAQFGRGTYVSGTAAVGFPIASEEHPLFTADGSSVELSGGAWGGGRLVPTASGGRRPSRSAGILVVHAAWRTMTSAPSSNSLST